MKQLEPIKQQALIPALGGKKARQACLPTCFFILAKANGYIDELSLEEFVTSLNWQNNFNSKMGWLRARLSDEIRRKYGVKIISWQLLQKGLPGILARRRMKNAGYFSSRQEWKFFKKQVAGRSVLDLAKTGYPVVISMLPGFDENKDVHAVIMSGYENGKFRVLDPNANNDKELYSETELHKAISPLGAASIILPK